MWGVGEYGSLLDAFILDSDQGSVSSQTAVTVKDYMWQSVLGYLCHMVIMLNESDVPSSPALRPDFCGYVGSTLVAKGEAKAQALTLSIAQAELTDEFHPTAYLSFPNNVRSIPGFATSREQIWLISLSYDLIERATKAKGKAKTRVITAPECVYSSRRLAIYDIMVMRDRVLFIQDLFKIVIWIKSLPDSKENFHLISGLRRRTRNGHFVTLRNDGLFKEFRGHGTNGDKVPYDLIDRIYNAPFLNVERGTVKEGERAVLITTVGRELFSAIRLGIVTAKEAFE
jgi:hypothetical protein